jgi:predicted adenine nucleotide alpha hydrolase (AANH) superfamily ATPase
MVNKTIRTSLPILWMGLIFYLSHQPYDFFPIKITNIQQIAAHIFLYAVLAYLIVGAVIGWKKWRIKNILLFSIFFSIFYGITDEYHQSFIPGRYVSFADLFFDSVGAFWGAFLYYLLRAKGKPKLLLHICCAGCGAYVSSALAEDYNVFLYFYNPNIFPESEYRKRLEEARRIAKKLGLKLIIGEYDHNEWLKLIKGFEGEPERGKRCLLCYRHRLNAAAKLAEDKKIAYFTTTLTVSPHKDAKSISVIGNELTGKYNVFFLDKDFKKRDGFKKSCELSKELGLYRQSFCGCEFSKR